MRIPVALLLLVVLAAGQEAPPNGPRKTIPGWHALVNATVHTRPGETLATATVVIKDGRIIAVGKVELPAGARVWDCTGLQVYAGFIDLHVAVDPEPNKPAHWNPKVTPERIARAIPAPVGSELRALGFTAAVAAPKSGIFRGRASFVSLAPTDPDRSVKRRTIYSRNVYQAIGFERFGRSEDGYPTSLMGAIAVIRQRLHDGVIQPRLLFDCDNELNALRAAKIAREFNLPAILLGSGLEFRRLDAIRKDGLPVILPLRLPPPPDVASVGARHRADLRELMTWETAPSNPRLLHDAGVKVSLTTSRLKKRADFFKQLRKMTGLAGTADWLAMLTTNPAELLGVENSMGTVEKGRLANLCVWAGAPDRKKSKVVSVWIDGQRHEVNPRPGPKGVWDLGGKRLTIRARSATLDKIKSTRLERRNGRIDMVFSGVVYSGRFGAAGALAGHATRPDSTRFAWSAKRLGDAPDEAKKGKETKKTLVRPRGYPFGPYALNKPPAQRAMTFIGATVWTSGPQGILPDGQVEIRDGRIVYVGKRRPATGATVDLKGKHITPGIIDCHSHTGISAGVNDSGQAVTAEVRIGDVTNPDSISWYRQLAGGVTTVNNLHGSANPIGGQSQTNKIRWGVVHPDQMHFEGAMPGIKFALGENVKQSNWGDKFTTRYPQTRMGVETLMRDRFLAAREYIKGHERVDLELEALAEILQGKRLIHCHSYRQDEILMLCRLAGEFKFRIGTFQHILEGYKVAEAIREHAIGASAFSDWWAYKVEVQDAIPFNGPIMHRAGVNVSFNSDSDDLARRLNIEAAKAIKYGGLERAEAFLFVTKNPAIQLGISKRVGSLETGKDADLAIWSGDTMSPYSICLSTWIDGREYFSIGKDKAHRARIAKERQRIVALILAQPEKKARGKREAADGDKWWIERFEGADCGVCGVVQR